MNEAAREEICASCHGSGTTTAMHGGLGPDDYEVDVSCPKCGGTGTLPATPKPRAGEHVEPWRVGQPRDSSGVRFIEEGGHATIGKIYDEEDARRIVVCVNFLEGIKSEDIESGRDLCADLKTERDSLAAQNRELREALHSLIDVAGNAAAPTAQARTQALSMARALLAKHGR